jgi:hypothetical protein
VIAAAQGVSFARAKRERRESMGTTVQEDTNLSFGRAIDNVALPEEPEGSRSVRDFVGATQRVPASAKRWIKIAKAVVHIAQVS